jgi:alpha-1,2-mannosyltransferase
MLSVVADRTNSFNNSGLIASSPLLSRLKLIYYHAFAWLYACAGRCSQLTMVNSTWTRDHIASLWRPSAPQPHIVYPPVDTDAFAQLTNISERLLKQDGVVRLLSIGQFRPEKDHRLQLDMFAEVLHRRVDKSGPALTLVLAGSCRHDEDIQRVREHVLCVDTCVCSG